MEGLSQEGPIGLCSVSEFVPDHLGTLYGIWPREKKKIRDSVNPTQCSLLQSQVLQTKNERHGNW